MASLTMPCLEEPLRQARVDHTGDTAAFSPAESGDRLCHLLFVDDDFKNAIPETQDLIRRQEPLRQAKQLLLQRAEALRQLASQHQKVARWPEQQSSHELILQ